MLRRITTATPKPAYSQGELERPERPPEPNHYIPMPEKYTTKETREIVRVIVNGIDRYGSANEDGDVSATEWIGILAGVSTEVFAAIKDADQAPKELLNLNDQEIGEIVAEFKPLLGDNPLLIRFVRKVAEAADAGLEYFGVAIPNDPDNDE